MDISTERRRFASESSCDNEPSGPAQLNRAATDQFTGDYRTRASADVTHKDTFTSDSV